VAVLQLEHAAPPWPQSAFALPARHVVGPVGPTAAELEQQPLQLDVVSQTHCWAALQRKPGPTGAVVQFSHATPPVPQVVFAVPVWQTPLASQQPLGHEFASHLHVPAVVSQAFVSLSGEMESVHLMHRLPALPVCPQLEVVSLASKVHVPGLPGPFEQHPLQDVPSQITHWPWSAPLAVSHRRCEVDVLQVVHAAPATPQLVSFSLANCRHEPSALQHPFGQVVASHWHWCVAGSHSWTPESMVQSWQVAPLVPHAVFISVVMHVVPLQQPLHSLPLQVHWPRLEQAWPVAHAWQKAPLFPHWPLLWPLVPSSSQAPGAPFTGWLARFCGFVQQPPAQDVVLQTHSPKYASPGVVSHCRFAPTAAQLAIQAEPGPWLATSDPPHVPVVLKDWQTPLESQHPLGHVVASHVQVPSVVSHKGLVGGPAVVQFVHTAPPLPQSAFPSVPPAPSVKQDPPILEEQQPLGQELGSPSHTQDP
jgi:hypothetical protein